MVVRLTLVSNWVSVSRALGTAPAEESNPGEGLSLLRHRQDQGHRSKEPA